MKNEIWTKKKIDKFLKDNKGNAIKLFSKFPFSDEARERIVDAWANFDENVCELILELAYKEVKERLNIDAIVGKTLVDRTYSKRDGEYVSCRITEKNGKYVIKLSFHFADEIIVKQYRPINRYKAQNFIDILFSEVSAIEIYDL